MNIYLRATFFIFGNIVDVFKDHIRNWNNFRIPYALP